jgi:alpha-galactosidase
MQIKFTENFSIANLNDPNWTKAEEISIEKYWSGEPAPIGRHFKTKILWSATALYVRFEANQIEPLVISETPNLSTKTHALWERDVCEIFIAPNPAEFRKYFEFEVAPTGEWIDLQIHQLPDQRKTDFEFDSGMQTAAKIEDNKIWMAFKVEWEAFDKTPKSGGIWKGNIFRCIGAGENRGYLAWQPTMTEQPNFHVPEKFGEFEFVK